MLLQLSSGVEAEQTKLGVARRSLADIEKECMAYTQYMQAKKHDLGEREAALDAREKALEVREVAVKTKEDFLASLNRYDRVLMTDTEWQRYHFCS